MFSLYPLLKFAKSNFIILGLAAVAVVCTVLVLRIRKKSPKTRRGVRLLDTFKLYVPGLYPLQLLEENRNEFKKAGVLNPEKFLRNLSLVSSVITLSITIAAFVVSKLELIKIPTSTVALPIPHDVRPYLYAVFAYLLHPVIFSSLFVLVMGGKISSRKESIEVNLHSLYIAMLGFAKARLPVKEAVREIMLLGLGELSKEFARIYYATRYGNMTLKAAMLEVAGTTPSPKLAEFLRGIVGVMEAGGDLARYVEDRIQNMEVEQKIIYGEYLKKLEMLAEVYLTITLAIPIMVVSIQLAKSLAGQGNIASVYGLIYGFMPLTSVALILIMYGSSPEKNAERPGSIRLIAIPIALAAGFAIGLLRHNIEFWALAGGIVGSAISAVLLRGIIREDEKLSAQLPQYFNRILSLVEAGKDTTTAFKIAAEETPLPLGKYVKAFAEMIDKGVPRSRAFDWLFKATPSSDLKLASKILSKTVDVSGRLSHVLLSLVGELMRISAFRKERNATAMTYGGIMFLAAILFLGIPAAMSSMLISEFEKIGESATSSSSGSIGKVTFTVSPVVTETARTILRHASYVVCVSAAVGVAAVRGDFRRVAFYLTFMLTATTVAGVLFIHLRP